MRATQQNKIKKIWRSHRGIAILEVLIAAFIFAAALLSLLQFQSTLLQNRGLLSQQGEAFQLAQDKMESFRNYTTLTAYNNIASGSSVVNGITATFTITWTVTAYPNTTNSTTAVDFDTRKDVRIVVTWTDAAGVAHTCTSGCTNNNAVVIDSTIASIDPVGVGKISQGLP
ncbi:MAG TPA: hypothetical protein VJK30_00315 [Coxiellaceae bacterium]|nr:MAG: hypothetical protein A3E81_08415 [Gammaproteobacteria bacterium RIFCSPHIGHO2_12_FULL_36_30]HLB55760.1 hypothetical protein [Coxiellaceae bacterium]